MGSKDKCTCHLGEESNQNNFGQVQIFEKKIKAEAFGEQTGGADPYAKNFGVTTGEAETSAEPIGITAGGAGSCAETHVWHPNVTWLNFCSKFCLNNLCKSV